MRFTGWAYVFVVFLFGSCGVDVPGPVSEALQQIPKEIDFNEHVKPIISDRCFACHGPDQKKLEAGLRLDLEESAKGELPENSNHYAIVPGRPGASTLIERIMSADPELMMPPPDSKLNLSDVEKAILLRWIEQGAEYKPHWAFIEPEKLEIPENYEGQPIDFFIEKRLNSLGLGKSPRAKKEILLRRVSFDLTGMPPTLQEMDAFLTDKSVDAYEEMVDRMLASPRYGEHMAAGWMDLARYADTHGYTVDRFRDMSPWRDWVIQAFNKNMPYDQFVTWQLAGDLLPDASHEQILATGFNRNHQQNMEGGIVPEEFRVEYVADRTHTLGTAFLGLTLECARCHDHKYDPVSQKEYYQLFSFFNNVNEAGQISFDNATPVPTLLLSAANTNQKIDSLREQIINLENEIEKYYKDNSRSDFTNPKPVSKKRYPSGMVGYFDLDDAAIYNKLNRRQKGTMRQQHVQDKLTPDLVEGKYGRALLLDGDAWLDLGGVGAFDRYQPFSVGLWINIPASMENGVIFHKGEGALLYNFRGFHVAVKNNKLELLMARTMPENAIVEYAGNVPRDKWIHLMLTHDGSGKADGLRIYLNGKEQVTEVENDNLYKSILFGREKEPGIQIGARWRGVGAKNATVDEIVIFDRQLADLEIKQVHDPEIFSDYFEREDFDGSSIEEFNQYYLFNDHACNKLRSTLEERRKKLCVVVDTLSEVMVMNELPKPRNTHILERGLYDNYGDQVEAGTPSILLDMDDTFAKNRLGLARWLFDERHPTTARVTVNRIWQQFFGRGLVLTSEDFGNQGRRPSHTGLLDWLAVEFRESGWDIRHLIKKIVMSDAYRQSSIAPEELFAKDPENKWLARGPTVRLTAEMMRDNVLQASGLLVEKLGGPSVYPYQPEDLWRINGGTYQMSENDGRYRRSLYTIWKRTVPHPTQAIFDAPSRSICTARRQETSTPLQALVLLNDPLYLECAIVLGVEIASEEQLKNGIETAFRKLTGRRPSQNELDILTDLQRSEESKFIEHTEKAKGWLVKDSEIIDSDRRAFLASCAVVASTIMNADATMIKR